MTNGNRSAASPVMVGCAPFFIFFAISLLIWNEGNYLKQKKAFTQGLNVYEDLSDDFKTIDPDNDGKLVHFTGIAKSDSGIFDTTFGVGNTDANTHPKIGDHFLKIKRNVEMYQWIETVHTNSGNQSGGSTDDTTTTCTYSKRWSEFPISSDLFTCDTWGHRNPEMLFTREDFEADDIRVGAFQLSHDIVKKMNWWRSLPHRLKIESIPDDSVRVRARVWANGYYFGYGTPTFPAVGDTRVTFRVVPSQVISIMAKQTGNGLSAWTSKSGGTIQLVEAGYHSPDEMFQHANASLLALTWLCRVFGSILVCLGFHSMFEPLSGLADGVPVVGTIAEAGNWALSLLFGTTISVSVIVVAYFANRLFLLVVMFLLLGGGSFLVGQYSSGKREYQNTQEPRQDQELGQDDEQQNQHQHQHHPRQSSRHHRHEEFQQDKLFREDYEEQNQHQYHPRHKNHPRYQEFEQDQQLQEDYEQQDRYQYHPSHKNHPRYQEFQQDQQLQEDYEQQNPFEYHPRRSSGRHRHQEFQQGQELQEGYEQQDRHQYHPRHSRHSRYDYHQPNDRTPLVSAEVLDIPEAHAVPAGTFVNVPEAQAFVEEEEDNSRMQRSGAKHKGTRVDFRGR